MNKKKILITSALPYVNNVPHLGNIIGCVLPGDVISRYFKQQKKDVLYVCGADEYGTCTEVKAQEEGLTPRNICDKYIKLHKQIYDWFQIEFDYFGRTSTKNPQDDKDWLHTQISQDIFIKLADNGYLIEKEVKQLWCDEEKKFYADRFVIGICPNKDCSYDKAKGDQCDKCGKLHSAIDLIDPRSIFNYRKKLEIKTSSHLFLNLPKLEPILKKWYLNIKSNNNTFNFSQSSIDITDSWLGEGLKERCITRDLQWGTPVPETKAFGDKYSNKVMYNWFDAPIGYISITANYTKKWQDWWKNPKNVRLIQTYGVDNCPFHTIIFPASLLGTHDNYTLASDVSCSYYLNYDGGKFSKSDNRGVFGDKIMTLSISSDVWRFYLIYQRPEKTDTEFKWDDFQAKVNGILNGNLLNLIYRIFSFTYKKMDGIKPTCVDDELSFEDKQYKTIICSLVDDYHRLMNKLSIKDAFHKIFEISSITNKYIYIEKPWSNYKTNITRCNTIISVLFDTIKILAELIYPFMPLLTKEMLRVLNIDSNKIEQPRTLFTNLTNDQIKNFKQVFG